MIWALREVLCSILDRPDILEFQVFDEVIHSLDLLPDAIEECDIQLWHDELEWDPWESSTRTDIEEPDWHSRRVSGDLTRDTHSIERVDEVLLDDTCLIADS